MKASAVRSLASCLLLIVCPIALFSADAGAAMLYTNGSAWVNGVHVPHLSSAIFLGDLLQTRADSLANINEPGSIVTILPDSLVQFEMVLFRIEHGGVTVATSEGVAATAGNVKVTPATHSWTEFDVFNVGGRVRILARKGDVTVSDGSQTATLAQGQETTREASTDADNRGKKTKKKAPVAPGAVPAAEGGILDSPYAVGIGAAAVAGATTWVLLQTNSPASPSIP